MSRRTMVAVGLIAGLVVAATACGGDDDGGGDEASTESGAESSAVAGADAGAFPVTIEHKYGSTEIPEVPERVVTVGLTDHDAVLALGVVPVATTEWYGEHPSAVWPWAQDELEELDPEAPPEVVGDSTTVNLEAIAAQQPDVILGLYSGLTQEQYDQLSEIAPTVAPSPGTIDYGIPWQDLTLTVGQVLGRSDQAEQVVEDVEAEIAAVADEHPDFEGATGAFVAPYEGSVYVYAGDLGNARLLRALGFEFPEELGEVSGEEWSGEISLERLDLLDLDVLIWLDAVEGEGPLAQEVYTSLPVHTEGREIMLDSEGELSGASYISALSIPFVLEELTPMLEAALDGDPATPPT